MPMSAEVRTRSQGPGDFPLMMWSILATVSWAVPLLVLLIATLVPVQGIEAAVTQDALFLIGLSVLVATLRSGTGRRPLGLWATISRWLAFFSVAAPFIWAGYRLLAWAEQGNPYLSFWLGLWTAALYFGLYYLGLRAIKNRRQPAGYSWLIPAASLVLIILGDRAGMLPYYPQLQLWIPAFLVATVMRVASQRWWHLQHLKRGGKVGTSGLPKELSWTIGSLTLAVVLLLLGALLSGYSGAILLQAISFLISSLYRVFLVVVDVILWPVALLAALVATLFGLLPKAPPREFQEGQGGPLEGFVEEASKLHQNWVGLEVLMKVLVTAVVIAAAVYLVRRALAQYAETAEDGFHAEEKRETLRSLGDALRDALSGALSRFKGQRGAGDGWPDMTAAVDPGLRLRWEYARFVLWCWRGGYLSSDRLGYLEHPAQSGSHEGAGEGAEQRDRPDGYQALTPGEIAVALAGLAPAAASDLRLVGETYAAVVYGGRTVEPHTYEGFVDALARARGELANNQVSA